MGKSQHSFLENIQRVEGYLENNNLQVLLFKNNELIHTSFDPKEQNLSVTGQSETKGRVVYARVDQKQRLLTVEQIVNDLTIQDCKTGVLEKQYPGNEEEPYRKSTSHSRI